MSKKHILAMLAVCLSAITLVAALASAALKPVAYKNKFSRIYFSNDLKLLKVTSKSDQIIGIAGTTSYQIFFKTKNPGLLATVDWTLENLKKIPLNIPNNDRIASVFSTYVDSPFVQIMAGNSPSIISSNLSDRSEFNQRFAPAVFTRAIPISNNAFIIRGFDTTKKEPGQIFMKGSHTSVEMKKMRMPSQIAQDLAGISDDGYLNYDRKNNLLTYVLFYQNEFICFDTSMNYMYSVPMINNKEKVSIEVTKVGNQITNSTPTLIQNGISRVSDGRLYNISKLRSQNEDEEVFLKNFTIDVYNIKDRKYEGSFHIPNYRYEKPIDFQVIDRKVLVLYRSSFAIYSLPS